MNQIAYTRGQFLAFVSTRDFFLGSSGVKVFRGTTIEFDGSVARYGGDNYNFPQLKGAVNQGWLMPVDEYDADAQQIAPVAGIQVRSPNGGKSRTVSTTVEADEHIVMGYQDHAKATKATNNGVRTASVQGASSEGVEVRRGMRTATHFDAQVTNGNVGALTNRAEGAQFAPAGVDEDAMLARMPAEKREEYLLMRSMNRLERERYVMAREQGNLGEFMAKREAAQGKEVARIATSPKTSVSEGMKVTTTSGGGIETWDGGDAPVVATIKGESAVVEEDGIKFTQTTPATGKKPHKARKAAAAISTEVKPAPEDKVVFSATVDVRRTIAKTLCPDFPDSYDFNLPDKKKLARLQADFEDRADVLRAVFAAESDAFKAKLVEEFPQAFQA
jgi:hypothetical protein